MPTKINTEILTAAIEGYEEQKKRLDRQIADVRQMLGGSAKDGTAPEAPTTKNNETQNVSGGA